MRIFLSLFIFSSLFLVSCSQIRESAGVNRKNIDEFKVVETEPIRTGHPEDPDWGWDGVERTVDDALSDLTELEAFAKNKSTTQIHKKKGTKPKDTSPDWEPPDYDY